MISRYYNNYDNTLNVPSLTARIHLTATTEVTYTIPGDESQSLIAVFNYGSDAANVYVGFNATATIPAANATETSGFVESKPEKRFVKGGDVLHFISPDANVYMSVSFYSSN